MTEPRMTIARVNDGWDIVPAPTAPAEAHATVMWLLDNQRRIPAHLLIPFCAAALGRPVSVELATALHDLDRLAQAAAGVFGTSDERAALRQDTRDALAALDTLPDGPAPGDRVMQHVGDDMLLPPQSVPALVLGVDGDQVTTATKWGTGLVDLHRVTVVERAVYVAVDPTGGAS